MRRGWMILIAGLAAALILGAACGGDGDDNGTLNGTPRGFDRPGGNYAAGVEGTGAAGATAVTTEGPAIAPTEDPNATPAPTPTPLKGSTVAIDADASTAEVEAAATYAVGGEFTVAFVVVSTGEPYQGYQIDLLRDSSMVSYVSLTHLKKANLTGCTPTLDVEPTAAFDARVFAGCLDVERHNITETGALATITFRCDSAGSTALRLLPPSEITAARNQYGRDVVGPGGTKLIAIAATEGLPLTVTEATVTCA